MDRTRVDLVRVMLLVVAVSGVARAAHGQDLLDRIVARVDGVTITLTDVRAAIAIGIVTVPPGEDPVTAGMRQMIDRQLMATEVQRFPPPEPSPEVLDREAARLAARATGGLGEVERTTGLTAQRLHLLARENLRTAAYLDQRFGTAAPADDLEAAEYYRAHPDEFTVGGQLQPYEDVAATARTRAAERRRQAAIAEWLGGLRMRADLEVNAPGPSR
jgi:hypothetical protein